MVVEVLLCLSVSVREGSALLVCSEQLVGVAAHAVNVASVRLIWLAKSVRNCGVVVSLIVWWAWVVVVVSWLWSSGVGWWQCAGGVGA